MSEPTSCPHGARNTTGAVALDPSASHKVETDPPVYSGNLYSRDAIRDPYARYRDLRDLGPAVWSSKHRCFVVARYQEVHDILADDTTFRSTGGVAHTRLAQWSGSSTTIVSDDERHAHRRKLVTALLTPRALRGRQGEIEQLADDLVSSAVDRGDIDGVDDLALPMPLQVVPDLVGWPQYGRGKLLDWGIAGFDYAGPRNALFLRSLPGVISMRMYVGQVVRRRDVQDGSAASILLAALDDGQITKGECASLLIDLLAPSIDTTASIIAAGLQLFADRPDQWKLLREDRTLMPSAVREIVRLASPLRAFTRRVNSDTIVSGVRMKAGSRVLVIYASANRDDRFWSNPDDFDITRDSTAHVGFGYGVHSCAGQGLGRMETTAILSALLDRVERIDRRGPGERATNNVIFRWEKLPLRLAPLRG